MSYDPTDCEMGICGPCESCQEQEAMDREERRAAEDRAPVVAPDERGLSDDTQARPEDVARPCEDCGKPGSPCPGCGKVVCQSCGEAEGEYCRCFPPLPPPGPPPPPLAPSETARMIGLAELTSDVHVGPCVDCEAAGFDHAALVRSERTDSGDLIDAWTGEVLEDAPGWDKDAKRIINMEGLESFGRLLMDSQEAIAENNAAAAVEIEALSRKLEIARLRLERANRPFESRAKWLRQHMEAFAQTHRAAVLKGLRKDAKSRLLACGVRVGWRKEGGEYRWRKDMTPREREEALLRWVKGEEEVSGESLTEYVPKPDLDEIKRHLAALDEAERAEALAGLKAPPGLEWVPESEAITIKTGEEK